MEIYDSNNPALRAAVAAKLSKYKTHDLDESPEVDEHKPADALEALIIDTLQGIWSR